uniref:hypothetical protein n=1 Tax=Herbidospora sakaeratensis TaxID=564415 RepID=UPI0012FB298F|nr:hypothetical protein [Herbidospora sakaeratensis]
MPGDLLTPVSTAAGPGVTIRAGVSIAAEAAHSDVPSVPTMVAGRDSLVGAAAVAGPGVTASRASGTTTVSAAESGDLTSEATMDSPTEVFSSETIPERIHTGGIAATPSADLKSYSSATPFHDLEENREMVFSWDLAPPNPGSSATSGIHVRVQEHHSRGQDGALCAAAVLVNAALGALGRAHDRRE